EVSLARIVTKARAWLEEPPRLEPFERRRGPPARRRAPRARPARAPAYAPQGSHRRLRPRRRGGRPRARARPPRVPLPLRPAPAPRPRPADAPRRRPRLHPAQAAVARRHHPRLDEPECVPRSPRLPRAAASSEHDPLLRRARSALARSRSRHACAQGQDLARRGFVVGCLDAALLRSRRALLPAVQGAPALRRRRLRPRRGEATARSPALLRRPAAHPPRARTPGARRDPRLPLSRTPSRAPAMRSCVSSPL